MPRDKVADPLQAIADLQRDLAQCRAERDEALAQQTATAEVLQAINSSPGDLAPVFDALLEKAMHLCQAAFGALWTYDGEYMHAVATRGVPSQMVEFLRQGPHPPARVVQRSIIGGAPYEQIADLRLTDGYHAGEPLPRAGADLGGVRTLLGVALRKNDNLLGVFGIYRQEVRPFTDKQIALLQNFAAQAVIAMENARLITETREALEQQTATAEVLQAINSSPSDLAPVFDAMLDKALRLCGAGFGIMSMYDGERFHRAAARGIPVAFEEWRKANPLISRSGVAPTNIPTALRRLLAGEDVIQDTDLKNDEPYRNGDPNRCALVDLAGARSDIVVALRKDDALLGALTIFRQEVRPFSGRQVALLQNFAAQAVIAMENARLITETREALDQQTATAEVLEVINSSPGDLRPVFDAMLEKAMRLCEAAFGTLLTYDGERFAPAAACGVPPAFTAYRSARGAFPPPPGSALDRVLRSERPVHILDVTTDEAYRTLPVRELGGCRTMICVALRKDDYSVIGAITAYRQEVRPFTDKQIELLENFAAQAVIAMENARLLGELRERTEEVAGWNRELEARVAAQLAEIERTGKLRRFLAPQLADLIVAQGDESILESHRREIVVVFCDVRGFTGFAERSEPEEVMAFLRDYHAALGPIVARFEGTLDHYGGDGIMVFFNDPLPTPEPAKRAIEMAVAMREAAQQVLTTWRRHGHDLGFGVGISQGYATLGQIGFAERMDYTAIGTVTNLAARLCGEAKDGQILISRRVAIAVEDAARLEEIGDVSLKGLSQAVAVFNVVQ
jgi:class 3 adenylate cyclase